MNYIDVMEFIGGLILGAIIAFTALGVAYAVSRIIYWGFTGDLPHWDLLP